MLLQRVMETSKHRRRQLEEMALILAKNKRLQSSVNDLDASLTIPRRREEDLDLELKVLALEKEHHALEVEKMSLTERLSHGADQQKIMICW